MSLAACGGSAGNDNVGAENIKVITPVTVVSPENVALKEQITLNATSTYLLKVGVKANINGYIQSSVVKLGESVGKGNTLFVLKTKEAESLGNTINKLDPSFKFSGLNYIKSQVSGFVSKLSHQTGDYVQDGEQLLEMVDKNSFGFLMNLPYEYNQLITKKQTVIINLPDGRIIPGVVSQVMPALDSITQTQKILIKVAAKYNLPENLIATVSVVKNTSSKVSVPKESVLSDDGQQEFWVMKLTNDSTAVKIPIKKGIETDQRIEVLSPTLKLSDKILLKGNYGLADTALVRLTR